VANRVLEILDDDLVEQVLLALDVVEKVRLAEVQRIRNVLRRDASVSLFLHQSRSPIQDVPSSEGQLSCCRGPGTSPTNGFD
jgi:hypothetical protein